MPMWALTSNHSGKESTIYSIWEVGWIHWFTVESFWSSFVSLAFVALFTSHVAKFRGVSLSEIKGGKVSGDLVIKGWLCGYMVKRMASFCWSACRRSSGGGSEASSSRAFADDVWNLPNIFLVTLVYGVWYFLKRFF